MVQQPAHSIIAELEDAVRGGSPARRVETLRQVTDLFLNDGERLSEDQVKVFDDVLCLLDRARRDAGPGPNSASGWRRSTTRRSRSSNISPGTTRSRSPARCWPIPAGSAPKRWSRSPAARGRTICSRFRPRRSAGGRHRRHRRSRRRQGHPQARQQRQRAVFRSRLFRHRRPRRRRRRTGRDPRPARRSSRQIPARPAAPRQGSRSRPAVGHRAAGPPGRDPAGAERHRARGAAVRTRDFGVAEELVKLMKELNELDDAAVYKFAEASKFDEVTVCARGPQRRADRNDGPRCSKGPRADLILFPAGRPA